jgi:toxin ParE1/3/4
MDRSPQANARGPGAKGKTRHVRVIYVAASLTDLEKIGDWISQENNVRSQTFVEDLRCACDCLGDMPRAYPLIPRHPESGIRRKPFHSYLIFYWIKNNTIEILRVLHAARDYERILFPG